MIQEKFIYVLDKATRDELLRNEYKMIGSFEMKDIYVFVTEDGIESVLEGHNYFPSNKISF